MHDADFIRAAAAYMDERFHESFPLMKGCAENGDARAQFLLALMFKNGEGTTADEDAYRYWLERLLSSAQAGNAVAQWELSCKFRFGNHFPLDIEEANRWLQEAAHNGNADAQFHLALYHRLGEFGFAADFQTANLWLMKAIEQEHPEAMYTSGIEQIYAAEQQKSSLPDSGVDLVRRAANAGFGPAQEALKRLVH